MKKTVLPYIMTVAYVVNVCQWMKYVRGTTLKKSVMQAISGSMLMIQLLPRSL